MSKETTDKYISEFDGFSMDKDFDGVVFDKDHWTAPMTLQKVSEKNMSEKNKIE